MLDIRINFYNLLDLFGPVFVELIATLHGPDTPNTHYIFYFLGMYFGRARNFKWVS